MPLSPEEVFTPRSATVNHEMYVPRQSHEIALKEALRGPNHIIIHGESGTGKSWLYKKVFEEMKVAVLAANMASTSRWESLDHELQNLLDREESAEKTGYEEEKSAEANAYFLKGQIVHKAQYAIGSKEPFERCLALLRERAGPRGKACLVFDNMERIVTDQKLLRQVADAIILLDDERYAKYNVKIALVGVPSDIRSYFAKVDDLQSVSNRLTEIPEVSRLGPSQAAILVTRGFALLKYKIRPVAFREEFANNVPWLADYIPQHIQELCLKIATAAESEEGIIDPRNHRVGIARWVESSLIHQYAVIEAHMDSMRSKVQRRNQALFALANVEHDEFTSLEVEKIIRRECPTTTNAKRMAITQILGGFANNKPPLLRKTNRKRYRFCDPRLRIAIRCILQKDGNERVSKVDIRNLASTISADRDILAQKPDGPQRQLASPEPGMRPIDIQILTGYLRERFPKLSLESEEGQLSRVFNFYVKPRYRHLSDIEDMLRRTDRARESMSGKRRSRSACAEVIKGIWLLNEAGRPALPQKVRETYDRASALVED